MLSRILSLMSRNAAIRLMVAGLLLAASSAACSDGGPAEVGEPRPPPTSPASTTTTEPGGSPTPRATAGEALEALLRAEQDADHATSYRLLDPSGRAEYRDVAEWTRRRVQLPPVTGFSIERDAGRQVVALVRHEPGLDPFTGLSAAEERQTWNASKAGDGYLLGPEPDVEYLLPPDDEAGAAVLRWAEALQACNQAVAESRQAVRPLFGASAGARRLCGSSAPLETGEVTTLDGGPRSADLVAQYSTDALAWARVVPLRGPDPQVHVVVAPIGASWQVVAAYD
jgi:hypothetical protein